jgi:hypothetical protein
VVCGHTEFSELNAFSLNQVPDLPPNKVAKKGIDIVMVSTFGHSKTWFFGS